MANKTDKKLVKSLHDSGVRKKVAKSASESVAKTKNGKPPKSVKRTVEALRHAASDLERQAHGSSRSEASKKAARTRKRKAAKRSKASKKAARTRAGAR